ncbi:hypothetical protein GCM10022204_11070 [Microlunatus aurantiacus]|uniref:Uncharacterized protein n=1 Tax=Microlunatus aurantiacus TaxID=446786 RepID=A0ABP7D0T8_9ACTN
MADSKKIHVEVDGQVLAQATIATDDEDLHSRAQVTMAPGHRPVGAGQTTADAVHEAVCEDEAVHLTATVPRGEAELIDGLRSHLTDVDLRAAGATSIIEGDITPS